jgi:hypothetical protein
MIFLTAFASGFGRLYSITNIIPRFVTQLEGHVRDTDLSRNLFFSQTLALPIQT